MHSWAGEEEPMKPTRRLPIGVEVQEAGAHFRVWSPRDRPTLVFQSGNTPRAVAITPESGGYYSTLVPGIGEGARYGFRFADSPKLYPDPASRFQPEGPHGLSQVIDPARFRWTDHDWRGVSREGQVIYELHI